MGPRARARRRDDPGMPESAERLPAVPRRSRDVLGPGARRSEDDVGVLRRSPLARSPDGPPLGLYAPQPGRHHARSGTDRPPAGACAIQAARAARHAHRRAQTLKKTRGQTLAGRPPAVADVIAEKEEEDPRLCLLRRNKVKALQLRLEYHIFAKHFCRKCKNYTRWRCFPGWWQPGACLQPRASWASPRRSSAGALPPSKRGWGYACFIAPRAACGSPTKGRATSIPAPGCSQKSRKPTPQWARAASSRR